MINYLNFEGHNKIIDEYYAPKIDILPRTPDEIYVPPKIKKRKRIWTFPISIWAKDYRFETEEMLKNCFERDWNHCKIPKVVKNPEDLSKVRQLLFTNYK